VNEATLEEISPEICLLHLGNIFVICSSHNRMLAKNKLNLLLAKIQFPLTIHVLGLDLGQHMIGTMALAPFCRVRS